MSLQEDVIRTMTDPLCSVEHRADKIVSKILDAAAKEAWYKGVEKGISGPIRESIAEAIKSLGDES